METNLTTLQLHTSKANIQKEYIVNAMQNYSN